MNIDLIEEYYTMMTTAKMFMFVISRYIGTENDIFAVVREITCTLRTKYKKTTACFIDKHTYIQTDRQTDI